MFSRPFLLREQNIQYLFGTLWAFPLVLIRPDLLRTVMCLVHWVGLLVLPDAEKENTQRRF